jgi:hypothetical protein
VIQAAITLKMGNFEETGAIVAAMTTSVPSIPTGNNWDYRYVPFYSIWFAYLFIYERIIDDIGKCVQFGSRNCLIW